MRGVLGAGALSWPVGALVVLASLLALAALSLPFAVDDAFIVARYAENLAHGHGWAMNPGVPSDGVTAPLLVLLEACGVLLGLPPLLVARVLGIGAGAAAAVLVVRRLARRAGGGRASLAAALLLAVAPQYAVWCMAGLETGMAALCITLAALGVTRRPSPRPVLAGMAIAALAALRPEAALLSTVLLLSLVQRSRRAFAVAALIALGGAAATVAFRVATFGDPLPLSFYAKPGDASLGLGYAVRGIAVVTGLGGALLAVVGAKVGRRTDRWLAGAALAHVVAVILAGGDWMPGFRLLAPIVPLYVLVAAAAFTRMPRARLRRRMLMGALLVATVVTGLDAFVQIPRAREAGQLRESTGAALAARLAEGSERIALVDVGYLPYASGLEVVDLGGVTDARIAHARGGHLDKIIDVGYLAARDPDLIVLHSVAEPVLAEDAGHVTLRGAFPVEYRVAATPWLRRGYRVREVVPYGARYHYVVFERR